MSQALLQAGGERAEDSEDCVSDITRMLERVEPGDPQAAADLLPLVYQELRRLAAHKMAQEKAGQTLQATALVHEAWLRLNQSDRQEWRGREHFFRAAAEAMRRILVENARRKLRTRTGGQCARVDDEWLDLPLAEAVAGQRIDDQGIIHRVDAKELIRLRHQLGS